MNTITDGYKKASRTALFPICSDPVIVTESPACKADAV